MMPAAQRTVPDHADAELIDRLGSRIIREWYGISYSVIYCWRKRGIPRAERASFSELMLARGATVPVGFVPIAPLKNTPLGPSLQRKVVEFIENGESYGDAADHFGISRGKVAGIVARAKRNGLPEEPEWWDIVELPADDDDWETKAISGSAKLLAALQSTHPNKQVAA